MTRKPPLAEAQTALRKQKYVLWNAGICPIPEILRKTAFRRKILLKSGNRLLSYGQKRFSIWRPFVTLNFIGHVAVIEFQICVYIANFIQNKIGRFFVEIFTIFNMAAIGHLEFSTFKVFVT